MMQYYYTYSPIRNPIAGVGTKDDLDSIDFLNPEKLRTNRVSKRWITFYFIRAQFHTANRVGVVHLYLPCYSLQYCYTYHS